MTGDAALIRAMSRLPAAIAAGFVLFIACTAAAQDATAPNATKPRVREIRIPSSRTADFLKDRAWQPISAADYRAFRKSLHEDAARPPDAEIATSEYSAVFAGDALREGTWSAELRRRSETPAFVPLDPMNLVLSRLSWEDRDAAWGCGSDGRLFLLVEGRPSRVQGRWILAGRKLARSVEFQPRFAPAASTRMKLRTPAGYVVTVTPGDVRGPQPADKPGWNDWLIDLGSRSQCRLLVSRSESAGDTAPPILLTQIDTAWQLRDDSLRVRSVFDVDVLESAVSSLEFTVPADLQIFRVSFGGEATLPWKLDATGAERVVRVQFPEPVRGRLRPIRLEGISAVRAEGLAELPQCRLKGAVLLDGQAALQIDPSLSLIDVRADGLVQTSTASDGSDGQTLIWRQDSPSVRVFAEVAPPRAQLTAALLSELSLVGDAWLLRTVMEWKARSGQAASVRCAVPAGWDVQEVQNPDSEMRPSWDVSRAADGSSILTVEFPVPVSVESSRRLELQLRRSADGWQGKQAIPVLLPQEADVLFNRLAIGRAAPVKIELENWNDGRGAPMILGAFTAGTRLAQSLAARSDIRLYRLPRLAGDPAPSLQVFGRSSPFSVHCWIDVALRGSGLSEDIALTVTWDGSPGSRLLVYLTGSNGSSPPVWSVADSPTTRIAARRLPTEQLADWNLPAGGELWELDLPAGIMRTARLIATGVTGDPESAGARLVFLPEAARFRGAVALVEDADRAQVELSGLSRLDSDEAASAARESGRDLEPKGPAWSYRAPSDSLEFSMDAATPTHAPPATARMSIHSVLRFGTEPWDLHEALIEVPAWRAGDSFALGLSTDSELIGVEVNRRAVTTRLDGERIVVPGLSEENENQVFVRYRTPSRSVFLRGRIECHPPTCPCEVIALSWECAMPPGFRFLGASSGLDVHGRVDRLSWRQRVFGILGRPAPETIVNPFSAGSWLSQKDSALPGMAAKDDFPDSSPSGWSIPPGWSRVVCTAGSVPQTMSIAAGDFSTAQKLSAVGALFVCMAGLALRWRSLPVRGWTGGIAVSLCIASLLVLPDPEALVVGGCLTGALLAMICPRRFLRSWRGPTPADDAVPPGSTATYLNGAASIAVVLLVVGIVARPGLAQNSTPSPEDPSRDFDVLVPFDESSASPSTSMGDVVYLSPELAAVRKDLERATSQPPELLISRSLVTIRIDAQQNGTADVRCEVFIPVGNVPASVSLPLGNANLAGDGACLLDGLPVPLTAENNGRQIRLIIPGTGSEGTVARRELALKLNPRTESKGDGAYQIRMRIPYSGSALMKAIHEGAPVQFDLPGVPNNEESNPQSASSEFAGAASDKPDRTDLLIRWSPRGASRPAESAVHVEASHLVEVAPAGLQVQTRLLYHVQNGAVDFVECGIPARAVVLKVTGDNVSAWTHRSDGNGGRRLLIEFASPVQADAAVDVSLLIPPDGDGRIPPIPAFDVIATGNGASPQTLIYQQLGIHPRSDYRLSVGPLPAESFRPLSPDVFQRAVSGTEPLRKPESCWQILRPAPIPVSLSSVAPSRKVRMTQEGRIGAEEIHWTMTAEVTTTGAPAFRHRLVVDPRLEIDRITVTEDQADRLVRWSRRGDRIELLLSDRTTGAQDVFLSGRLPWTDGVPLPLPLIRIEDAESADSRLRLWHNLDLKVEFSGELRPAPLPADSEPARNEAGVLFGMFRLPSTPGESPTVRITRDSERPSAQAITRISNGPDKQMQVETVLRLSGLMQAPGPIALRLPAWAAGEGALLAPEGVSVQLKPIDAGIEATLVPPDNGADLVVRIRNPSVVAVPEDEEWRLPIVETPGLIRTSDLVVTARDCRWRPVPDASRRLESPTIPSWSGIELADGWDVWDGQAPTIVRLSRANGPHSAGRRVLLRESHLRLNEDGALLGRTEVVLNPGPPESVPWRVPEGVTIRAAFAEDEPVSVPAAPQTGGTLRLAVPGGAGARRFVLHWSRAAASGVKPLRQESLPLVEPEWPASEPHRIAVVLPPALRGRLRGDDVPVAKLDLMLASLESWTDIAERESAAADSPLRHRLLVEWPRCERAALREIESMRSSAGESARARIEDIRRRVEAFEQSGGESNNETAADPDSGDGFSGVAGEGNLSLAQLSNPVICLSRDTAGETGPVRIWIIDERPLLWVLAGLVMATLSLASWKLLSLGAVPFLQRYRRVAWIGFGIVWWLCLSPSALGLAIAAVVAIHGIRQRRAAQGTRIIPA